MRKMEKAQEKLKVLLLRAEKEKLDLWKIPAIKNRGKLFEVDRKFKVFVAFTAFLFAYGKFGDLYNSEKVKCFYSSQSVFT